VSARETRVSATALKKIAYAALIALILYVAIQGAG
jgi:hypothetical protein